MNVLRYICYKQNYWLYEHLYFASEICYSHNSTRYCFNDFQELASAETMKNIFFAFSILLENNGQWTFFV